MYKIIIVEDDKEIREELTILLKNSGYDVICITDFENVENSLILQNHLLYLWKKFTKPFIIFMKEENKSKPYFSLKVDNDNVLKVSE